MKKKEESKRKRFSTFLSIHIPWREMEEFCQFVVDVFGGCIVKLPIVITRINALEGVK